MTQTVESALGFLAKLVDMDVLHQGFIEVALGIVLHLDTSHSTRAYNFYLYELSKSSTSTKLIKKVDFRVPANQEKAGNEFLYISLESSDWLNASAIIEHYGQPLKVIASTPQENMGTGVAVTYVYLLGKWDVSFSFGSSPQEPLLSIALERHKKQ
jgi:hypothetical protein